MKIRNVVWDEKDKQYKVVWFNKINKDNTKHNNYIDYKDISEYKKIEIINTLSVLKKELKHNPQFGISIINKNNKEFLDLEILNILRNDLNLIVYKFDSSQVDREYRVDMEIGTFGEIKFEYIFNLKI